MLILQNWKQTRFRALVMSRKGFNVNGHTHLDTAMINDLIQDARNAERLNRAENQRMSLISEKNDLVQNYLNNLTDPSPLEDEIIYQRPPRYV